MQHQGMSRDYNTHTDTVAACTCIGELEVGNSKAILEELLPRSASSYSGVTVPIRVRASDTLQEPAQCPQHLVQPLQSQSKVSACNYKGNQGVQRV